jgi:FkbM family methyltransferase
MPLSSRFKGAILDALPERLLRALKKRHYARKLALLSEADEKDFPPLRYLIGAGDHVVDVGANFGLYTKWLSHCVGEAGRVYAVEPIPQTCEILRYCVNKLGLTNAEVINCAVSDSKGGVSMEVPRFSSGGENYYEARIVKEEPKGPLRLVRVPCQTIDGLLAEKPNPISFLKVDVEGHELRVLRGARRTIERSKPAWLIEVSDSPDDPQSTARELFRLLERYGYSALWFDGARLRLREAGVQSTNYFFLVPGNRKALGVQGFLDLQVP